MDEIRSFRGLVCANRTFNGQETSSLDCFFKHSHGDDALRRLDEHIYIHSKRLADITDAEIMFNAGKLALVRTFNLVEFHNEEVEEVMAEEMIRLGLTDVIARMNASAW